MNRSINELLVVLLDNINSLHYNDGLCCLTSDLYLKDKLSLIERNLLHEYIENNRPSTNIFTFLFNSANVQSDSFYWRKGRIGPRKRWLKKHIKKTS